jgi:hypothetical protein
MLQQFYRSEGCIFGSADCCCSFDVLCFVLRALCARILLCIGGRVNVVFPRGGFLDGSLRMLQAAASSYSSVLTILEPYRSGHGWKALLITISLKPTYLVKVEGGGRRRQKISYVFD